MKTARDVMSHTVLTIAPFAGVADATRKMEQNHIHSLLVERVDSKDSYGSIA